MRLATAPGEALPEGGLPTIRLTPEAGIAIRAHAATRSIGLILAGSTIVPLTSPVSMSPAGVGAPAGWFRATSRLSAVHLHVHSRVYGGGNGWGERGRRSFNGG